MVGCGILIFSYGYIGVLQCCFCVSALEDCVGFGSVATGTDQGWLMYFLLTPDIGRMIKEYEPVSDYGHQDTAEQ